MYAFHLLYQTCTFVGTKDKTGYGGEREREAHRQRERERETVRQRQRDGETVRDGERERDGETVRDGETERERETVRPLETGRRTDRQTVPVYLPNIRIDGRLR